MPGTIAPQIKLDSPAPEQQARYLLRSTQEILFIMRELLAKHSLFTAYFNENEFFLTAMLHIGDDGTFLVDSAPDSRLNRRVLSSPGILFISALDNVRIEFETDPPQAVEDGARKALRLNVPKLMLRMQRRECFRLPTSIVDAVKCSIALPAAGEKIEIDVLDLSASGIALMENRRRIELELGTTYSACRLWLPEHGAAEVTLEVRDVREVVLKNGQAATRFGCRFVDLDQSAALVIQRYVLKLERERNAKRLGR